jgi:hypothetical protein
MIYLRVIKMKKTSLLTKIKNLLLPIRVSDVSKLPFYKTTPQGRKAVVNKLDVYYLTGDRWIPKEIKSDPHTRNTEDDFKLMEWGYDHRDPVRTRNGQNETGGSAPQVTEGTEIRNQAT